MPAFGLSLLVTSGSLFSDRAGYSLFAPPDSPLMHLHPLLGSGRPTSLGYGRILCPLALVDFGPWGAP